MNKTLEAIDIVQTDRAQILAGLTRRDVHSAWTGST
jgi:hypothetical protein